jgi:hypothetical protein
MERFLKMDLGLDVIMVGAKVTQLDAVYNGVKPPCHLAVEAEVTLTWHEAYVMGCDAKHDAVDPDAMSVAKTPDILARSPGRRSTRSMINGAGA